MAKTLSAILAVARERISGANPAGRETGVAKPATLGKDPAVDYAPKPGDERKFVAKHNHIEQEYPNGMKDVFQGNAAKYSMDTPQMATFGNKQADAVKAYDTLSTEEVKNVKGVTGSIGPGMQTVAAKKFGKTDKSHEVKVKGHRETNEENAIAENEYSPYVDYHKMASKKHAGLHASHEQYRDWHEKQGNQTDVEHHSHLAFHHGQASHLHGKAATLYKQGKEESGTKHANAAGVLEHGILNYKREHNISEDQEDIDEMSRAKVLAYKDKAKDDVKKHAPGSKKFTNRARGVITAAKKTGELFKGAKVPAKESIEGEQVIDEKIGPIKHPGLETRLAKKAGEGVQQYARQHYHDKGKAGKRARFAVIAPKWNHHHEEVEVEEEIKVGPKPTNSHAIGPDMTKIASKALGTNKSGTPYNKVNMKSAQAKALEKRSIGAYRGNKLLAQKGTKAKVAPYAKLEHVDEHLSAKASASTYIDDFVHSKNKRFEGKSKKKRINMALGAYYSHHEDFQEATMQQNTDVKNNTKPIQTSAPAKKDNSRPALQKKIGAPKDPLKDGDGKQAHGKIKGPPYQASAVKEDFPAQNRAEGSFQPWEHREEFHYHNRKAIETLSDHEHHKAKAEQHADLPIPYKHHIALAGHYHDCAHHHLKMAHWHAHSLGIKALKEVVKEMTTDEEKEIIEAFMAEMDDNIDEAGILCDKNSLSRKMSYHFRKIREEGKEGIGKVKFRHHLNQVNIIHDMRKEDVDEEVELTEKDKKKHKKEDKDEDNVQITKDKRGFQHIKRGYTKKAKNEEVENLEEVWKATTTDDGKHIIKHKTGKIGKKTYGSKAEAIDAAVRLNKNSGAFKEELEDLEEVSKASIKKQKLGNFGLSKAIDGKKDGKDGKDGKKDGKKDCKEEVDPVVALIKANLDKGRFAW